MRTLLKYDFRIQLVVILIFTATVILLALTKNGFLTILIRTEFFILAIVQYTLNIAKFYSKNYLRTLSRIIYISVSSYVVVSFLLFILGIKLNYTVINNFFEWMPISWLAAAPVLIIQSLVMSFYDRDKQEPEDN